jgi:Arc/MetJ-type ribon-helix-helix transcriptional regulator
MGRTISIYIDDDILERIKKSNQSVSKVVRDALREWLDREVSDEDYRFIEESLYGTLSSEGEKAWHELCEERDRW